MKNRKRYLCMIVFACILLLRPAFLASAEEDRDWRPTGYVLEDRLYVFLDAEGEMDVTLSLNGQLMNKKESLEKLEDSGGYVHYYFILDRSGTMKPYAEQIEEFVKGLMENTKVRTKVTMLSLGDRDEVEMESVLDKNAVLKGLSEIAYDEMTTDIYKGIASALEYAKGQDRRGGELYYMILFTDGELDNASEEPTFDQIKEQIENRKDLVFTAVRLGEKEDVADLSFGNYITGQEIASAASEIAGRVNSMYTVCFELDSPLDENLDIKLISMEGGNEMWEITGIPTVFGSTAEQDEEILAETQQEKEKDKSELEEEVAAPEKEKPELGAETTDLEKEDTEEAADAEQREDSQLSRILLYGVLLLGGIAAGCGLALFWKKKQGGSAADKDFGQSEQSQGISLCVEVISGRCLTKKRNFSLHRNVIIGSGRKCDIIWEDADVSEQNARIFMRDGIAYIEDLDSLYGTAINGMRIHTPNPLRNGDMVSIGRVQFRVLL